MNAGIQNGDDIISIRQVVTFLLRTKWIFIVVIGLSAVLSVIWAMSLNNEYTAEALLVPNEAQGKMTGLGGDIGGLASLAGLEIGSGSASKPLVALELIKSKAFLVEFIEKYDLLPVLLAAERWDAESQELHFNPEVYDIKMKKWVRNPPKGKTVEPRPWEGIDPFLRELNVNEGDRGVVTTVAFTHLSPIVAAEIVSNLVKEMNYVMRQDAIHEAEESIQYLEDNVIDTKYQEVKAALFALVEEQLKNLMLAKVRDEYVFKTVSKPIVPEEKSGPSRGLICIIITFLGGVLALFIAIFVDALRPAKQH